MATERQFLANRQNAMKSTGPRTPEGKEVSSRNALKHGLRTLALLPTENQTAYQELAEEYYSYFEPEGPVETSLVDEMIWCDWCRRERAVRAETQVLAHGVKLAQETDGWLGREPSGRRTLMKEVTYMHPGQSGSPTDARHGGLTTDGEGPEPASQLPEEAGDCVETEIWPAFNNSAGTLERIQRYETMYDKKYYRALHELNFQALRRGRKGGSGPGSGSNGQQPGNSE